jgi:hypothetical protein
MITVQGVHHVKLPVSDLTRSRRRYESGLDGTPWPEFPDGNGVTAGFDPRSVPPAPTSTTSPRTSTTSASPTDRSPPRTDAPAAPTAVRVAEIPCVQTHPRGTTTGRAGTLLRHARARHAALCVLVAVTSACGSARHSPPPPAAGQVSTGSVRSATTAAPGSTPSPAPRPATDDSAGTQRLCNAISLNLSMLTKAAESPNDPSLTESIALIRRLRDTAPTEIKNDLQVIADFDDKLLATARSGGSPDGVAETPQLTQALSHEARWTAAHCPR